MQRKRITRFLGSFALLLAVSAVPALARQRLFGYCEQGGTRVLTNGATSKTRVQASFPGCTVTVFLAGTTTQANPVYSDNNGTVKSNPFTAASTDGYWFVYVDNGRYDIKLTGGSPLSIPAPGFTRGDYLANDQGTAAVATYRFTGLPFNASPQFDASLPTIYTMTLTGNVSGASVINSVQGQTLEFNLCQDSIGGRTFIWPGNFVRPPTVGTAANSCTNAIFSYNGTNWLEFAATGDTFSIPGTQIITNGVPVALPTSATTLVGRDTTDTLTNKTLSAPNFTGFSTYLEIATPGSNPAAGSIFVYAKTGDVFCAKSSGGSETCFGAGGGGNATSIQGNAVKAQTATLAGQMWAWNTANSDFEIQTKPYIDVRDWGIVCDGPNGTDNAAKAQTMLNANPGGRFVWPGNSVCRFTAKITPKGTAGVFEGGGAGFAAQSTQGTTLKWDSGVSGLEMLNANGSKWVIKHLNIVGGDAFIGAQGGTWPDAVLPNFTDQTGFNMFNRSITSISRTANVATVTTTGIANEIGCHTYSVGTQVKIAGVTGDTSFNTAAGGAYITGVSAVGSNCFNTFTYASTGGTGSGTVGGATVQIMNPGTSTADGIIAGMNYLTIEDVNFSNWGRFDINCSSDSVTWWCDDVSIHQVTMTNSRGVGLYIRGGDANAGDFSQINGQVVLAGCIVDLGFLGNQHSAENCTNTGADVVSVNGATKAISAISCASQVCTATTSVAHGLVVGNYAVLAGLSDATFQAPAGSAVGVLTVPDSTHFTYAFPHADGSTSSGTARLANATEVFTAAGTGQNSTASAGTGLSFWISGLNNNRNVQSPYCEGTSGPMRFGGASIVLGGAFGCSTATGFNNFPFFQAASALRASNWTNIDGNLQASLPDLGTQVNIRGGHFTELSSDIALIDHTGTVVKWQFHDLTQSTNAGWGIFRGSYPTNQRFFIYEGATTANITSMTRTTNVVTVTVPSGHHFSFAKFVTIAGSTGGATSFNGFFQITGATDTTFTFAQSGGNESATPSTGTATTQPVNYPGEIHINGEAAGQIRLNYEAGTGGVCMGSGASTCVGTVDSSGNAVFSGRGTFNGGLTSSGAFSINLSATGGVIDFASATSTIPWIAATGVPNNASCTKTGMGYFQTDGVAGQEMYFCKSGTWTQQLNSGGGGASTSLGNLASVAFNVAITPAVGNLGTANADIGAGGTPVNAVWIGAAVTNNIKLTGTATGARVATLPDNSGTIAELNLAQSWTAAQTFTQIVSGTANPSASGLIRLASGDLVAFRNNANSNDIAGLQKDASDIVQVGDTAGAKVAGPLTTAAGDLLLTSATGVISLQTNPLGTTIPNDAATATLLNQLACINPIGTVSRCGTGVTSGVIGVVVNNAGTTGSATIAQEGQASCVFDSGAVTIGHFVIPSTVTAGDCADGGVAPNAQPVGIVLSLVTGTTYNVLVTSGSPNVGTGGGGVSLSPGITQTIQATATGAIPLVVACNGASTVDCFEVLQPNGTVALKVDKNGVTTFGSGTGIVTSAAFVSAASNPASGTVGNVVRLASTDNIAWRNNANSGDVLLGKNASDFFTMTNTAGFAVKLTGATTQTNVSFATPGVTQTLTVPDSGGASDTFMLLAKAQTFSGKVVGDQLDITELGGAPSNPAAGFQRFYADTASHTLKCLTSAGANCLPTGGGGSTSWSAITNPASGLSLTMGANASLFTYNATTGAGADMFKLVDTTGNTGTGTLFRVSAASGSAALPVQFDANGNGVRLNTNGYLSAIGTGGFSTGDSLSVAWQIPNDGVTGTTNNLICKLTTSDTCITVGVSDVAGVEGIVASGGATSGNALVARQGVATCTFSNATTVGDYVGVSTATAGNCLDLGANPTVGVQILGRVLTSGLAATNQKVALYAPGVLAHAGTTNQVNIAIAAGVETFSLPQSINTGATVQFATLNLTNAIQGNTSNNNVTVRCGGNTGAASAQCTLSLTGANYSGTGAQNAGTVTISGGSDSSTSTGIAGDVNILAGQATAAANNNGHIQVKGSYIKGVTFTTANLGCFSATNTISDCATSATNFVGVILGSNGTSGTLALMGTQVLVNYDATVTPSAGWFACSSASVAGKVTAQAAACAAGRTAGIIEAAGTNVTSGNITVVHF